MKVMEEETNVKKSRILRCKDWLENQNSEHDLSQHNKNDIEFIMRTNAERKRFLLSSADQESTVPNGVEDVGLEPKKVPIHRLRVASLRIECEWKLCRWHSEDYEKFQKHVKEHISDCHVSTNESSAIYTCQWDVCSFSTENFKSIVGHINYHAYHARLLAIGFNARATLDLLACKKDSMKRNMLPTISFPHVCLWTDCNESFDSIQNLFDHVRSHVRYSDGVCSWAGCGARAPKLCIAYTHARSHTGEKLVACYHCGAHFANNRRLADHLRRQNAEEAGLACTVCGAAAGSAALLAEHARRHVNVYACALCDMSAPTRDALALHVRYRHTPRAAAPHACPHCEHRSVAKADLVKHMKTHSKRKIEKSDSDLEGSDDLEPVKKKKKERRKYACHVCPDLRIVYSRGSLLTAHLIKKHGAQWPSGHSRFRYQAGEDGIYRLTTTRYEILEVSRRIVSGHGGSANTIDDSLQFNVKKVSDPTYVTPVHYEITLKTDEEPQTVEATKAGEAAVEATVAPEMVEAKKEVDDTEQSNGVEITVCDVDEYGNVIQTKTIKSFVDV